VTVRLMSNVSVTTCDLRSTSGSIAWVHDVGSHGRPNTGVVVDEHRLTTSIMLISSGLPDRFVISTLANESPNVHVPPAPMIPRVTS
jgi:hypothetical protein